MLKDPFPWILELKKRAESKLIGYPHIPNVFHNLFKRPNNLARQELPPVH